VTSEEQNSEQGWQPVRFTSVQEFTAAHEGYRGHLNVEGFSMVAGRIVHVRPIAGSADCGAHRMFAVRPDDCLRYGLLRGLLCEYQIQAD